MTDWSVEDLSRVSAARLRFARLRQARQGSKSTSDSRVALVAFERGISAKELERFYYVNRKGSKTRYFDHHAFAEKYGVDIHWIWDGALCEHPRGLTRQRTRKNSRPRTQPQVRHEPETAGRKARMESRIPGPLDPLRGAAADTRERNGLAGPDQALRSTMLRGTLPRRPRLAVYRRPSRIA